jgi:hypothetical protein
MAFLIPFKVQIKLNIIANELIRHCEYETSKIEGGQMRQFGRDKDLFN